MHNKKDGEAYQPENGDRHTNLLPNTHRRFLLTTNHNNKRHYNNCSGYKQSNSQSLISLTAI
jgi:hypothetical protein